MKEYIRTFIVYLLTLEARAVLKKYKPRLIVVTGSVGKTSTKDATYAALKQVAFVRKSEKSYNSDIGAPLTILGVPNGWSNLYQWFKNLFDGAMLLLISTPYPTWLVVEVGADRPGDISKSLSWLKPTVVVTTRFPAIPVHVEYYASPEAVIEEELYPLSALAEGGVAVINADEPHTAQVTLKSGVRTLTYGFSKRADVRAHRYRVSKKAGLPSGITFDVMHQGTEISIVIPGVVGKTHVYAILGGMAGALATGATLSNIAKLADSYDAPPGRLRLVPGMHESLIVDDSYNSSPAAVEEALEALQNATHTGRRIGILGDMLELGSFSAKEHARIGVLAESRLDMLITVGVRARGIAEAALEKGMPVSAVHLFERGSDAASSVLSELKKGDVVLIKGSQSMRMERITKALMQNPEEAVKFLPRQDTEWLAR